MSVRVGLDIGGTKMHGVLLAPDGSVLAERRAGTVPGPEGVVRGAVEVVTALCAGHAPAGVGIGVPGLVDPASGSVRHAFNLGLDAEPFPLVRRVGERLRTEGVLGADRPVALENDLNASALGAAALLDVGDDLAYLALGTGVAVGLVLEGRLRRGAHGLAGEVGHLPVRPGGAECPCGQRGCLELYASGSGLAREVQHDGPEPLAAVVFDAAARGERHAREVRDRLLDGVADVVQMLVLTLDVGAVVLGGGIARLGEPLLTGVRSRLERREGTSGFLAAAGLARRVRLAPTDVPVGAVGAALALGDL